MQELLNDQGVLRYWPGFIAQDLFDELKQEIYWRQDQITLFGKTHPLPRLQAWYGEPHAVYTYSRIRLEPSPWTPLLAQLRGQLQKALGVSFEGVLCNLYRTGLDYAAWHSDNEPELGPLPTIASLSFGGVRRFDVRHRQKGTKLSVELDSGSLLVMGGPFQHYWQHQLARTKKQVDERINLTFRPVPNQILIRP